MTERNVPGATGKEYAKAEKQNSNNVTKPKLKTITRIRIRMSDGSVRNLECDKTVPSVRKYKTELKEEFPDAVSILFTYEDWEK